MPIDEFIITVFCWVELGFEKVTTGVSKRIGNPTAYVEVSCPSYPPVKGLVERHPG